MRHAVRTTAALAVLGITAVSGCDFIDSGNTYAGIVVDAGTGVPIEGIYMSLVRGGGGFGSYTEVDSDITDRDGAFRLHADGEDASLFVNSPGYGISGVYRPDYSSMSPAFYRDRRNMRLELQPITP